MEQRTERKSKLKLVMSATVFLFLITATLAFPCRRLPRPVNGNVRIVGDTAMFSCNSSEGFVLSGSPTLDCWRSWGWSRWSGDPPKCEKRYCASLVPPENGTLYLSGNRAHYQCDSGFRRIGPSNRTCFGNETARAQWSGSSVWCLPCPAPPEVDRGFLVTEAGLVAEYRCEPGLAMIGNRTITCKKASKSWTSPPTCIKLGCYGLYHPPNGHVHFNISTLQAEYTCNEGLHLFGTPIRTCHRYWSGENPTCAECRPMLLRLYSGHAIASSDGFEVNFTCNRGHKLEGSDYRRCNITTGEWSGNFPSCKFACDLALSNPDKGKVTVSSRQGTATYWCDRGYRLNGRYDRYCESELGQWTGSSPTCIHVCPPLSNVTNGAVTVKEYVATYRCYNGSTLRGDHTRNCNFYSRTWSGSAPTCFPCRKLASPRNGRAEEHLLEVRYSCAARYALVGNPIRTCSNESGLWTGSNPSCVYSRCGILTGPENGKVIYSLLLGTLRANYTCKAPLKLIGYSYRTCSRWPWWSREAPSCEYCYPLSRAFKNGVVTVSSDKLVTRYSCHSGHKLIGNTLQICNRTTALWSGLRPQCLHACPRLENVENGIVSTQGIRAIYRCRSGYKPEGNFTVRICNVTTGQWSGSAPSCVFGCSSPTLNINITNGFGTFMGTFLRFRCRPGYRLIGNPEIHCRSSFFFTELQTNWSEPFPACSPCRRLYPPSYGSVSEQNLQVTYRCREKSLLVGNEVRYCDETTGEWSGSDPSCKYLGLRGYVYKRCYLLRAPLGGQVSYSLVGANVKATYACRPGFSLQGNANRLCLSTSTYYSRWTGGFTPKCFSPRCHSVSEHLKNGIVRVSYDRVSYSCNYGYKLKGPSTLLCNIYFSIPDITTGRRWSNSPPQCELSCPSPKAPLWGSVVVRGLWAIYSCSPGHKLVGRRSIKCVSGKWSRQASVCVLGCSRSALSIRNGDVKINGSVAEYSCYAGYRLVNERKQYCRKWIWFHLWRGPKPWCTRCSVPIALLNGRVIEKENEAIYLCNAGHKLVGVRSVKCVSGNWSQQAPSCVLGCSRSALSIKNGDVRINGSVAAYSCYSGYRLATERMQYCRKRAMSYYWDGQKPWCTRCPVPIVPPNGIVIEKENKAIYLCNQGFSVLGSTNRRTCDTVSGRWRGSTTFCAPEKDSTSSSGQMSGSGEESTSSSVQMSGSGVQDGDASETDNEKVIHDISVDKEENATCRFPSNPPNGSVAVASPRRGFYVATYSCDSGFRLIGRGKRRCNTSRNQWHPSESSCSSECPPLPNLENGRILVNDSVAIYSCIASYTLYGESVRKCLNDSRKWIGQPPFCSRCPKLFIPPNGRVQIRGKSILRADYACNKGYRLIGTSQNYCLQNYWSRIAPHCSACPPPRQIENAEVYEYGSVARYTCDGRHILRGGSVIRCNNQTRKWSQSKHRCVLKTCFLDDNRLLNGKLEKRGTYGMKETFSCNDGFELIGQPIRRCINGTWNHLVPTCKRIVANCSEGEERRDACNRLCTCTNSSWSCCRERSEFTSMTVEERKRYIQAVLNVSTHPLYSRKYDNFLRDARKYYKGNGPMGNPFDPKIFLPLQRDYLIAYENFLRKIDCRVTVPYWDWSVVGPDPFASSPWGDDDHQLGGDGVGEPPCVRTGPFRAENFTFLGERCVERAFSGTFPGPVEIARLLALPADRIDDLERSLRVNLDLSVRCLIGGTMCSYSAFYAPEFPLHIAFIDKLLGEWEMKNPSNRNAISNFFSNNRPRIFDIGRRVCYREGAKVHNMLSRMSAEELEKLPRRSFSDLSSKALRLMKAGEEEKKKAEKINEFLHLGTTPLTMCTALAVERYNVSSGCLPLNETMSIFRLA